jgi:hypothetical protein
VKLSPGRGLAVGSSFRLRRRCFGPRGCRTCWGDERRIQYLYYLRGVELIVHETDDVGFIHNSPIPKFIVRVVVEFHWT